MDEQLKIRNIEEIEGNDGYKCEVYHLHLGWIPFAAMANDPEVHGKMIYQAIKSGLIGN
jgi:hypothetical protein